MAFSLELEVMSHDIDTNCNATPSAIVRYFGETVDRNMRVCSPSYQELFNNGLSFVVSRTAFRVYRPVKEYEKIKVTTWATISKSAAFPRNYIIESNGERVAECIMTWALLDMKSGKLLRGSDFDVSSYGVGDLLELPVANRLRIPKETAFSECGKLRVEFRDIDRNRHMNNTRYFDILFGYIPNFERYYLSACQMNYVSEAKIGDEIDIFISEPELDESGELSYYFRTETRGNTNIEAKFTLGEL